MKNIKYLLLAIAIATVTYFQVLVSPTTDFIQLYQGVIFNGRIYFYIRYFFLFACYSFYIYNEFETYLSEYGVILVTREQSRDKLFLRITLKIFRSLLQIELVKMLFYALFMKWMKGTITIEDPRKLCYMIAINILGFFIILFVQMVLEIYYSGTIALAICLAYFLFSLGFCDFIDQFHLASNKFRYLFLPNYMMHERFKILFPAQSQYTTVIGVLSIAFIILFFITKQLFRKKDIF